MAKKKEVVYTPPSISPNTINLVDKGLTQIPPYEDAGVDYRSKYKIQKSENTWELKNQQFRYYYEATPGGIAGFIPRPNYKTTVFYLKQIIINWHLAGAAISEYIRLYDGYNIILGGVKQFEFSINYSNFTTDIMIINLPVPIKFTQNNIGYDLWSGAAAGDWCNFTLVGWDELI